MPNFDQNDRRDPVCYMFVTKDSPYRLSYGGQDYFFCSPACLERFQANPEKYDAVNEEDGDPAQKASADEVTPGFYTCPMHSEVRQPEPGPCPKCGMALEPVADIEAGSKAAEGATPAALEVHRDPVCGMEVSADSPHHTSFAGQEYFFCSPHCLAKFQKNPETYLAGPTAAEEVEAGGAEGEEAPGKQYTCPMDPEIRQSEPGPCPKCGMALESAPCTRK